MSLSNLLVVQVVKRFGKVDKEFFQVNIITAVCQMHKVVDPTLRHRIIPIYLHVVMQPSAEPWATIHVAEKMISPAYACIYKHF